MRVHRLLQTHVVRFAVLYALLFCASAALLFAFIYNATVRAIDIEIDTALNTELANLSEVYDRMGLAALIDTVSDRSTDLDTQANGYLLVDESLTALAGNLPAWPLHAQRGTSEFALDVEEQEGASVISHRYRARTAALAGPYYLLVAHGIERRARVQQIISQALRWGLAAALLLGISGGLLSGRSLLRRTGRITETSARIMAGNLAERIPVGDVDDELNRLAVQLNLMFDRIEQLVEGMRTVSDSVAHDLRTPLTRLRGAIEAALMDPPDVDRYRRGLEEARVEADRVLKVFQAVMSIAQARSTMLREQMERLDLAAVVSEAIELYEPAIEARRLALELSLPPQPIMIVGHRQLLAQAFVNLLDNAVKFTPEGGVIQVKVQQQDGQATAVLADNGPGIPVESRERLLMPYARGDVCNGVPGTGLGLSLVAAVVGLHRGTLSFEDNVPGLKVTLSIPTTPPGSVGPDTPIRA